MAKGKSYRVKCVPSLGILDTVPVLEQTSKHCNARSFP